MGSVIVRRNSGSNVGQRSRLNLIEGSNITLGVVDDAVGEEVDVTITAAAGGGGNAGLATLDFGSFPGKSDASINVTGQAAITTGSIVQAWLNPTTTPDHTPDEHLTESLAIFVGNIVAATGFTIYGINNNYLFENQEYLTFEQAASRGGLGTLIYGKWSVGWRWS